MSDGTACDFYFIVTDHVGKPVLMLDSSRRIAGVGEAEPFGRINTVEWWNGNIPSTSMGVSSFSSASQPTLGMNLEMRPYFQTFDLELESCGPWPNVKYDIMHRYDDNAYHDSKLGLGQANVRMAWLPLTPHNSVGTEVGTMRLKVETDNGNCPRGAYQSSCFPTCSPSTPYSGVQLRRYDYRRYETVSRWGTSTSWKQTEITPAANWNQVGFSEDSSWLAAAEEDAYPAWPWGSSVVFPPSTPAPEWIWSYDSRWGSDTKTIYFRKTFTASSSRALITLTADNSFTAYLNGVQIATGNDWTQRVVAVVALVPGAMNVIAVVATNAGGPGGLLVDVNETTTPMWTALRFPGQYYDAETDLHENGHRFYDPELGRYLSPEPIQRSPHAAVWYAYRGHTLPAYSYALNNPVRWVDLDGRAPGDWFATPDLAALDYARWFITQKQASHMVEYCSSIFSRGSGVTYTAPVAGDGASCTPPAAPGNAAGTCHNHPGERGTRSSNPDKDLADLLFEPDYVFGDDGELWKYQPVYIDPGAEIRIVDHRHGPEGPLSSPGWSPAWSWGL